MSRVFLSHFPCCSPFYLNQNGNLSRRIHIYHLFMFLHHPGSFIFPGPYIYITAAMLQQKYYYYYLFYTTRLSPFSHGLYIPLKYFSSNVLLDMDPTCRHHHHRFHFCSMLLPAFPLAFVHSSPSAYRLKFCRGFMRMTIAHASTFLAGLVRRVVVCEKNIMWCASRLSFGLLICPVCCFVRSINIIIMN